MMAAHVFARVVRLQALMEFARVPGVPAYLAAISATISWGFLVDWDGIMATIRLIADVCQPFRCFK